MLAKYGIRVAQKQTKTLRSQLQRPRNTLKDEEKLDASIVRNTAATTLMTRMNEHRSAVRRRDTNSNIWAHISETGHVVDFKKAKVQE